MKTGKVVMTVDMSHVTDIFETIGEEIGNLATEMTSLAQGFTKAADKMREAQKNHETESENE